MKKTAQRLTALAMAAAMSFGAFGVSAAEPAQRLFGSNAITAEAAYSRWYPLQSNITVRTANSYAELLQQSGSGDAVTALKRALSENKLLNGVYKQRHIIYTVSNSSYNDFVMIYDQNTHPALDNVFFGSNQARGKQWVTSYMQVINTMKQMTGNNLSRIVLSVDESVGNSCAGYVNDESGNLVSGYVKLNAGASRGLEHCISAFSNYYFNWTILHETGHLFSLEKESLFNSNDDVYCNLTALCALRALKANGVTVPNVLRDNANGNLHAGNKTYEAISAMKYAETSMKSEYNTISNKQNIDQVTGSMLFYRLGLLFKFGLNTSVFGSNYVLDSAVLGKSDSMWNRLYAMCIDKPENVNAAFMSGAKAYYESYLYNEMTHTMNCTYNGITRIDSMSEATMLVLAWKAAFNGTHYVCAPALVKGLSGLDYLFRYDDDDIYYCMNEHIPGNSNISYWEFCSKVMK